MAFLYAKFKRLISKTINKNHVNYFTNFELLKR